EPAYTLFCDAVGKGIRKELDDLQKIEKHLPPKVTDAVDMLVQMVEIQQLKFRDIIWMVSQNIEAVIFMADVSDTDKVSGAFAIVSHINPSPELSWLRAMDIHEGKDYTFLKKESNGDFIIKSAFNHAGKKIEFCVSGLKLPGNDRYALLFSDPDNIQKYFEAFKEGRTGEEYAKGKAQKIIIGESCFRLIEKYSKQNEWTARAKEIADRVKYLEFSLGDTDGATNLNVRLSMRKEEDAKAISYLLLAYIASIQSVTDTAEVANFLQALKVETKGNDVAMTMKLDYPDLWKVISEALVKASDKIKKRNE
ncbi:MAG: hypothetical protein FWE67_03940, partial [Planctomycetaceae bacterium]|nr:hypothetical protein [Planctomycetaceae bacterium]